MSRPKPTVGAIWFHPIAGPARPFIVRSIKGGIVHLYNLDDGGEIDMTVEGMKAGWYLSDEPKR